MDLKLTFEQRQQAQRMAENGDQLDQCFELVSARALLDELQTWMKLLRDAVFSGNADISPRLQHQGERLLERVSRVTSSDSASENEHRGT